MNYCPKSSKRVNEVSQQVAEQVASRTKRLVLTLLEDGEWHSHRAILSGLIRTPLSEYEIRRALRIMRENSNMVEAEDRGKPFHYGSGWWYRLKT